MKTSYDKVRHFEESLHVHAGEYFGKHVGVFDEMMQLYLEPLGEVGGGVTSGEGKSAVVVLLARMFNDFECCRLLLLYGQPEQAHMPLRDVVECMMLIKLFGRDSKLASRWMKNLKEYRPADVKRRLDELEVNCPEYSFYGMLSQLTHANLLSVVSTVSEERVREGLFLMTYHFGGVNNPSWIGLVFNIVLILLWMALTSVVASVYFPYMSSPEGWWNRVVGGVKDGLVEVLGDVLEFEEVEEDSVDRAKRERVYKKMGSARIHAAFFDKDVVASDKGFPGLG